MQFCLVFDVVLVFLELVVVSENRIVFRNDQSHLVRFVFLERTVGETEDFLRLASSGVHVHVHVHSTNPSVSAHLVGQRYLFLHKAHRILRLAHDEIALVLSLDA